ncbi:hypothetical protein T492DRAFT_1085383 [Pavlovales sp. CCMP2436]|nr:hypothetical protein T492DRAFT_1085383 [Pavlovales sp. CCMP2436]
MPLRLRAASRGTLKELLLKTNFRCSDGRCHWARRPPLRSPECAPSWPNDLKQPLSLSALEAAAATARARASSCSGMTQDLWTSGNTRPCARPAGSRGCSTRDHAGRGGYHQAPLAIVGVRSSSTLIDQRENRIRSHLHLLRPRAGGRGSDRRVSPLFTRRDVDRHTLVCGRARSCVAFSTDFLLG